MTNLNLSRRGFLSTASAGLVIGVVLPEKSRAQSGAATAFDPAADPATFAPNAFVRVAPDDTVTVLIKHIEFGQGPNTGLATLVAEELDADWSQMRAESAPANDELYANTLFGLQGTGGSTAMANSYMQMRKAGAAARATGIRTMLPHVDTFRAGHNIDSLEALAEAISKPNDPGEKARLMADPG